MKHTSRLDIPQHKLVRSLVDYELIGRKWKRSDALSRPILIDRGLELAFCLYLLYSVFDERHMERTVYHCIPVPISR